MTRRSSMASACAAHRKILLLNFFCVIYFAALCTAQDPQNDTDVSATSSDPESTISPTVYVPPIPSLELKSAWSDVFPSEKVELACFIAGGPDWIVSWFRNREKIQESDSKLSLSLERSVLTITAGPGYSGMYTCQGALKTKADVKTPSSNPLNITVHENPSLLLSKSPSTDKMYPGESVTFTCTISLSSGWKYLWYHNGSEIRASSNSYTINSLGHSDGGQYKCKATRGKEPFHTPGSETSLHISDPPTPSLKRLSPWLDVFFNERVELSCEAGNPEWSHFTWYKDGSEVRQDVDADGSSLNMTSVSKTDEGLYTCKAHHKSRSISSGFSNTAKVTVHDLPQATLRRPRGFDPMYVGETVNFTCTVDVSSGWSYQWYKDGKRLPHTGQTIGIPLTLSDAGNYSCEGARGEKTYTIKSMETPQGVQEIPVPALRSITQWLDVFPGESMKLGCTMEGSSGWTYLWYKDEREIHVDSTVSFDASGATISIGSAAAKDGGQYKCKGRLSGRSVTSSSSSGLKISVYNKKPTVIMTRDTEYERMYSGESVTFGCHMNVSSGWDYEWYKDDTVLGGSSNTYSKDPIEAADDGIYKCRAKRGRDSVFLTAFSQVVDLEVEQNKPKPLMTRQPDIARLYAGESLWFKCEMKESSGWEYCWFKNGNPVGSRDSRLDIHNVTMNHSGTYRCMATRSKTKYNTEQSDERQLRVSQIPVPALKKGSNWLDVFPTERAMLACGMQPKSDWRYTWYKDGQELQAVASVSFDSDKTTLTIGSASARHRGRYSCAGHLKARPVSSSFSPELTLQVYDTKPRVTLTQTPEHSLMHTEDKVSFFCHVNVSSGWEYLWFKNNDRLPETGASYVVDSVTTSNSGSYKCQVRRATDFKSNDSPALGLEVQERPQAEVTLLTGWSEVFSTDTLVLKCSVKDSQDRWNYTWFKEEQPVKPLPSETHTVMPHDDPQQSTYTCQGIRTERPTYSIPSVSYKTKNLLLKRRVLLSISGCIFFGIIAVFLGCIVLRVVRKPAEDVDQPHESNLFLTMAQLKNRADAPCPLADYITEEALNAPQKEDEENGTVCSETTPLPISSQDDQAATNENHDKEENNGGMVSFKQ